MYWLKGRVLRTIKKEEICLSEIADYHDVYQQIARFLDDVYMLTHINSSLGYLTAIEFENRWREGRFSSATIL
jgi:hypothetical protein